MARDRAFWKRGLEALLDDIPMEHGLLTPDTKRDGSVLWFGPKGTLTSLHYDTTNILFVQVYGQKTIRLAPPEETSLWKRAGGVYAYVDPEASPHEDGEERPVPFQIVHLEPGDMLFIPVGWWHHVRATSASISLSFNCFPRTNRFDWFRPTAPSASVG